MEESDRKSKKSKPAPVTRAYKARSRPRKAKLRGVRPPRGLCHMAGLHYPNAAISPYKGDTSR